MSTTQTVNDLWQSAYADGALSHEALQVLQVADLGQEIGAALGVPADLATASEVVLVSMLVDDSGSIEAARNTQAVRDGYNLVIDANLKTKQRNGIYVHTRYLNGEVLSPYTLIDSAPRMDAGNYDPRGGTPLYDEAKVFLGTVVAKAAEYANSGTPVRCVSLIVTDGRDLHSRLHNAADIRKVVESMLRTEDHIIAAMALEDGQLPPIREVFQEMGIPDRWILSPNSTGHEIREAFQVFSQTSAQASQNAASFSQTAGGGFVS